MKTSKKAKPAIDLDALRDVLPHGSGIDADWEFRENADGSVRCHNAWHAMNEHGYYCGWIPFAFTVRVSRDRCAHCGEDYPCSASKRIDLHPMARALHVSDCAKGRETCIGRVRGGFKRASRASLYLDDLADVIGEQVCYALREAGSSVLKGAEGGAS